MQFAGFNNTRSKLVSESQRDLKEIQATLLKLDLDSQDPLIKVQTDVETAIFNCSLAIKRCFQPNADANSSAAFEALGIKLPKL